MVVVNNNGIYGGLDDDLFKDITEAGSKSLTIPPTSLLPSVRYEAMMKLFHLEGELCRTVDEIGSAFERALADSSRPHFLNVMINPMAMRKAQTFEWLTKSKM